LETFGHKELFAKGNITVHLLFLSAKPFQSKEMLNTLKGCNLQKFQLQLR